MSAETVEVTVVINAEPRAVWAVIGDVLRMPEWSQDLESVDLLEGDGRSVGSVFRGNNHDERQRWSMTCVIDRYDPGSALEFHTENAEGEARTRWWYRIEPVAGGTAATEGFLRLVEVPAKIAEAELRAFGGRTEHNRRNIEASLKRLAALVDG